jgi:hypothetical protein
LSSGGRSAAPSWFFWPVIEEREKAMNHRGRCRSRKAGKTFLFGFLIFAVMIAWNGVGASERYGMPSEEEAHRNGDTGTGGTAEQVAWVKSLRTQEDRLFVNGEPFVLKHQTRFENERGARIGLEDIPLGARIEVQYCTGSRLEESGYGPEVKILTRIRLVQPPPGKKPVR